MSSIWSSAATSNAATGGVPFATQSGSPTPGGGAAAKFQSVLRAAGKGGAAQPDLSPAAAQAQVSTNAAGGTASSAADASDAGISANDFLTLLVTEMQNQDPTADVDPNAYIDQLVQINSLEQLISINQNLATVLGAASSTVGSSGGTTTTPASSAVGSVGARQAVGAKASPSAASPASAIGSARNATRPATVEGNLNAPGTSPAAAAVGHALGGRASRGGHGIRDIPTRALP